MSDKDQKADKSGFSLQNEIKKRKTQEIQRAVGAKRSTGTGPLVSPDGKRTSQTTNAAPSADPRRTSQTTQAARPASDPRRSTQTGPLVSPDAKRTSQTTSAVPPTADARRTSQTMQAARPASDPRRTSQTTQVTRAADPRRTSQSVAVGKRATLTIPPQLANHSRRNLLIASIATILAVAVVGGSFLLAQRSASPTVTPTQTPMSVLPLVRADDIIGYLRKANVPISSLRQLPVDTAVWAASQEIQFDVQRSGNKATFIVLTYASVDQAVSDSFRVRTSAKFKNWQLTSVSNMLLLASPDAAPAIQKEMASHLTSYLLAPYRSFLPTPTALPTTASAATAPATP